MAYTANSSKNSSIFNQILITDSGLLKSESKSLKRETDFQGLLKMFYAEMHLKNPQYPQRDLYFKCLT